VVVRTHRQHGGYGSEEKHGSYFPFVPGQPFEILLRAEHDKYMVGQTIYFTCSQNFTCSVGV